jgi:uncharacterized protein
MWHPDADLVRRAWAAGGTQGDIHFLLDYLQPDVEIVPFGAAMEGKAYRGHDGVLRWWKEEIDTNWEVFETHAEDYEQVGDRMVIYGHWVARARSSGVELTSAATWVVDVRDGKIARWETYTDRAEALAAAQREAPAQAGPEKSRGE